MLDNLTNRFSKVLKNIRGQSTLTEDNIKEALREVRLALLEADVALPVVKEFVNTVKEQALGQEVVGSLTPDQAFIGVVNQALVELMGKENKMALIRLPSGEMRKLPLNAKATIGTVSNADHSNVRIGKAGRTRHMGIRPSVRGVVMNPCDHPHGGGEGKSPVGLPAPVTPWGKPALGLKTRKHKKYSDKKIVKRAGNK